MDLKQLSEYITKRYNEGHPIEEIRQYLINNNYPTSTVDKAISDTKISYKPLTSKDLDKFVVENLSKGYSNESIRKHLTSYGYPKEKIEKAISNNQPSMWKSYAPSFAQKKQEQKSNSNKTNNGNKSSKDNKNLTVIIVIGTLSFLFLLGIGLTLAYVFLIEGDGEQIIPKNLRIDILEEEVYKGSHVGYRFLIEDLDQAGSHNVNLEFTIEDLNTGELIHKENNIMRIQDIHNKEDKFTVGDNFNVGEYKLKATISRGEEETRAEEIFEVKDITTNATNTTNQNCDNKESVTWSDEHGGGSDCGPKNFGEGVSEHGELLWVNYSNDYKGEAAFLCRRGSWNFAEGSCKYIGKNESENNESNGKDDKFKIVIDILGRGDTEPSEGVHWYENGTNIEVIAEEVPRWEFQGFSGSCSGKNCTIKLTRDKEVTAHFKRIYYNCSNNENVTWEDYCGPKNLGTGNTTHGENKTVTYSNDFEGEATFQCYDGSWNYVEGSCEGECSPEEEKKCYDNSVYWYNSCGEREDKIENCGGEMCYEWHIWECLDNTTRIGHRECHKDYCHEGECIFEYYKENKTEDCGINEMCKDGNCTINLCYNEKYSTIIEMKEIINEEIIILDQESREKLNNAIDDMGNLALEDLENLNCIEYLDISGTSINDISRLQQLDKMRILNLGYTKVNNIEPLKNMKRLKILNLRNAEVTDISYLANLEKLEELNLRRNSIHNLGPISDLNELRVLDLADTGIEDISSLTNLNNLRELRMFNNEVSDISHLSNLGELEELELRNTKVSQVSGLSDLNNLKHLDLSFTYISDVSHLSELDNLKILELENTQVTEEDCENLKEDLPETNIKCP